MKWVATVLALFSIYQIEVLVSSFYSCLWFQLVLLFSLIWCFSMCLVATIFHLIFFLCYVQYMVWIPCICVRCLKWVPIVSIFFLCQNWYFVKLIVTALILVNFVHNFVKFNFDSWCYIFACCVNWITVLHLFLLNIISPVIHGSWMNGSVSFLTINNWISEWIACVHQDIFPSK